MMQIDGHVRIENKFPQIAFAAEAVFMPASNGYRGGLFDHNLNPISQAVSYRGDRVWLSSPVAGNIDVNALPLIQGDTPYFFVGEIYAHFGHFLLESTVRLWPLLYLPPTLAGNFLYCGRNVSAALEKKFIKDILNVFSLDGKDFITYDKPCRLKNVFVASPVFEIRWYASPIFREFMQHIGNTLANDLAEINNTNLTPLYLSKSKLLGGGHGIINETAIEEILRKKGVDIWHPETVDLATQVRELSSRKYLMGSIGSAFHSLLFCPGNKVVSGVTGERGINSNYIIIDKLCGNIGRYESGQDVGIRLFKESDAAGKSRFIHTFYASNPARVADALLRNLKL